MRSEHSFSKGWFASWLPSRTALRRAALAVWYRSWKQPFTITLLVILVLVAWASGSLTHSVEHSALLDDVGFGVPALQQGQLYTLLTSTVFSLFPWMLVTIFFVVLIGVLPFELAAGWQRTATVFTITQIAGYVLTALFVSWPLGMLGLPWGTYLATTRDVGPSAGAFGCLGAIIWYLHPPWRRRGIIALLGYLLLLLIFSRRIWDVEHAISGVIGMAIGWLLVAQGVPIRDMLHAAWFRLRPHPRDVSATLVVFAGVMNVLSALGTNADKRVATWNSDLPFAVLHGSRTFVVLAGVMLILLGRGLRQGRRIAWVTALVLLAGSIISHIVKGLDIEEAVIEAALLAGLIQRRHDFTARPSIPSMAPALRLSALALILLPIYAGAGMLMLRGQFQQPLTVSLAAREVGYRMIGLSSHELRGATFQSRWFLDSITFVTASVILIDVVALLRPVMRPMPEASSDRRDAIDLLHAYGDSPVGYMTTWPGNTLHLSQHRDAYVAYRLIGDIALVLGDPVGMPAGCPSAIREFTTLARRNGWVPCFYGASARYRDEYARNGLATMQVGEDAYIDLAPLNLRGKAWQDVRTALNKAQREGITFQLLDLADTPPHILAQLHQISNEWIRTRGLPEMNFTLGKLTDPPDPEVRVALARDRDGRVQGFVTWLPVHASGGWVVDIMRRQPDAFKGVMEYLIVQSALALRDEGAPFISLATAPLARVSHGGSDTSTIEHAIAALAGLIEPFYQTRSLFEFKRKFQPRWEPVYIAYPGPATLPSISYAILRAYLPNLGVEQIRALITRTRVTPVAQVLSVRESAQPVISKPAE